jgi:hypothetical protein
MKVKINKTIYDSTKTPILIIFNKEEISHIQNMADNNHLYCSFPDESKDKDIAEFMDVDKSEDEIVGYLQY